jgi:copper oxidase (laccase) domain-containing protein
MDLFKQAEKEYFSRKEQQLDAEACKQQLDIEACKHQLINLSGVMTCNLCGLETYPVFVSGYNCWYTAMDLSPYN